MLHKTCPLTHRGVINAGICCARVNAKEGIHRAARRVYCGASVAAPVWACRRPAKAALHGHIPLKAVAVQTAGADDCAHGLLQIGAPRGDESAEGPHPELVVLVVPVAVAVAEVLREGVVRAVLRDAELSTSSGRRLAPISWVTAPDLGARFWASPVSGVRMAVGVLPSGSTRFMRRTGMRALTVIQQALRIYRRWSACAIRRLVCRCSPPTPPSRPTARGRSAFWGARSPRASVPLGCADG